MKKKEQKTLTLLDYLNNTEKDPSEVSIYSLTNLFKVVSKGTKSYYSLSRTFNFINLDKLSYDSYKVYTIREKDTWTNISYRFYGTIQAWWIICKFNNIKNPFDKLVVSTTIKLPSKEIVNKVIQYLS